MLAKERHGRILNLLHEKGSVKTPELLNIFNVSLETIRRDLLKLEKSGFLQRVHGGAIRPGEMVPYKHELRERLRKTSMAKRSWTRPPLCL